MYSEQSRILVENAEKKCVEPFALIENIAFLNQAKVLKAFKKNKVSERHFIGTTGYGYGDAGRDMLCKLFADVFGAENAIVTPHISCASHALAMALFGILRPNDIMLSITGKPYDTLDEVIFGDPAHKDTGSLKDLGVKYEQIDLLNNKPNTDIITKKVRELQPKLVFMQRSRGYAWRKALSIDQIGELVNIIRKESPQSFIMVDNCYGEFTETREPTDVGADIVVGSLIKNAGGGLAPAGAYIVGCKSAINLITCKLTSPALMQAVGSYEAGYRLFFQGLFMAPHTVSQALKGSSLIRTTMNELGYDVSPTPKELSGDIVSLIKFNNEKELIAFCQAVQSASPIDSYATPIPWDMPGYADKVIMAGGSFVQGATIELSCDSPIRPPYIAYLQGGLTYEHIKIATMMILSNLQK
ncbi:MAG: methionine gamma-lyase family protein [Clostridia bacterium]|jgi:cystathionine beta-lyase family protein involved in aluminum resistance|nr:methionine gamma-lyase family protein [Clostridia bacterium]MDD4275696.1 methionine gamma-lyase family protein [Clostridia bacterium]